MKIFFLFAGINLNLIIKKNACFPDNALKTRGIEYLNVENWLMLATPIKMSGYAAVVNYCNRHQRIYVTNQLMDNFYVLSGILIEKCSFRYLVNSMQNQARLTK